jgi:hypothetical protein
MRSTREVFQTSSSNTAFQTRGIIDFNTSQYKYPDFADLKKAYVSPFQTIPPIGWVTEDYSTRESDFFSRLDNPFLYATRVPLVFQTRIPLDFDTLTYSDSTGSRNSESELSSISSWNDSRSENKVSWSDWFSSAWYGTDELANTALKYTSNWLRDTWNNLDTFEGYRTRASQTLTRFKDMVGDFLNKLNEKGSGWSNWVLKRLIYSNPSNDELRKEIKSLEEQIAALRLRQQLASDSDSNQTSLEPRYADSDFFSPEPRYLDSYNVGLDDTRMIPRQKQTGQGDRQSDVELDETIRIPRTK